jgi:hypothetical protein
MDGIATLPEESFSPGKEGTFELPDTVYHNHELAPGISRSLIVELLQKSPAHARSLMTGDFAKVASQAMIGGSLFDRALLEPHLFEEGKSHWIVPEGMKLSTKDGIAWKKDHPGLPYLRATSDAANVASAEDVKGMIESVLRHVKARIIVETGVKQESAFAIDKETGLMRKVRPDARIFSNNSRIVLVDVKSTFRGGAVLAAWQNQCARMAYHIQDTYYSDVYADLYERPYFLFIVVERKPPYACRIFQLDPEGKEHARKKCRAALEQFRRCQETGIWPAYNEEIVTVSLPNWEMRAPEEESPL